MENLIEFFRKEFRDDALEIRECIDLLNYSICESVESVRKAFNTAFDERDYEKFDTYKELLSTIDDIRERLDAYSTMLQPDGETVNNYTEEERTDAHDSKQPDYDSYKVDSNVSYTLYNNFTHKRPAGFELSGRRYFAKDWATVLVKTCEFLAMDDIDKFNSFINDESLNGKKTPYFSKNPDLIRAPKKVSGTDIYVMTNMSANQIRNTIVKMLRKYNIDVIDYKIFLRADYTDIHN